MRITTPYGPLKAVCPPTSAINCANVPSKENSTRLMWNHLPATCAGERLRMHRTGFRQRFSVPSGDAD